MEMKYPIQQIRCFPTAIYWNLKEPIILRISNSLAAIRQLEFKSVASVRSLYNVFEAMEKDTEAVSFVSEDNNLSDKEEERRRKIGLANKGKVPWNKGKKHSEGKERSIFFSIY